MFGMLIGLLIGTEISRKFISCIFITIYCSTWVIDRICDELVWLGYHSINDLLVQVFNTVHIVCVPLSCVFIVYLRNCRRRLVCDLLLEVFVILTVTLTEPSLLLFDFSDLSKEFLILVLLILPLLQQHIFDMLHLISKSFYTLAQFLGKACFLLFNLILQVAD